MKKYLLVCLILLSAIPTQAMVSKTINVQTAGTLNTLLTQDEKATVTDLIITGEIDASDFKILRDSLPVLTNLDLNTVNIPAYYGYNGTNSTGYYSYPANEIPSYAFYTNGLKSVVNTTLKSIVFPATAISIGDYAFAYTGGLDSIHIQPTITKISETAFMASTVAFTVDQNNQQFLATDGVLFNKDQSILLHCTASRTGSYSIPKTVMYIANYAFLNCSKLESILIPDNVTSIGYLTFGSCTGCSTINIPASVSSINSLAFYSCSSSITVDPGNLNYSAVGGILFSKKQNILIHMPESTTGNYTIPATVDSIGDNAFYGCKDLDSITIPATVKSIGNNAFSNCTGIAAVTIPPSITAISSYLFLGCTSMKFVTIPSTITSIGQGAFYGCTGLETINIPASVTTIGQMAFYNCNALKSIVTNSRPEKISLLYMVFYGLNVNSCTLNVPFGTKSLYQAADQWKSFTNIVENTHGFLLNKNEVVLSCSAGTTTEIKISSNENWKVNSDQSWVKVTPETALGNDSLSLTAELNPSTDTRTATLTFTCQGVDSQTISIVQIGQPKAVNIVAGGLSAALTGTELNTIYNLKITGTMDARDFRTMRDFMPLLNYVDISGVNIVAYSGYAGTGITSTYPANEIPQYAFYSSGAYIANTKLKQIQLPNSVTSIGISAFMMCSILNDIKIPEHVTSIGDNAFSSCIGLNTVLIPDSVRSIGNSSFSDCTSLTTVTSGTSLKTIGSYAFMNCTGLTEFTFPYSVTSIGTSAFYGCNSLTSITEKAETPPVLTSSYSTFQGVNTTSCILNVPNGSKALYSAAQVWQDFTNIVESRYYLKVDTTTLKIQETKGSVKLYISSNKDWTVTSDQTWLTVSPVSGVGNDTIVITATDNTSLLKRTATVTVSANDLIPRKITVTQSASPKKLSITAGGLASALTAYEKSIVSGLILTGTIDARDFEILRDSIPLLERLDITATSITAYTGSKGTINTNNNMYPANQVPQYAFFNLAEYIGKTSLVSVKLPLTITSIGQNSFINCNRINELTIPNTVLSIGDYAFQYCSSLTDIVLPTSLTTIGSNLFYNCSQLQAISIPATVTSIGDYAFGECASLDSVKLSTGLTTLGSGVFYLCSSLRGITIPNTVTSISDYAFWSCASMRYAILPDSLKSLSPFMFEGCTKLESVKIPPALTSIGHTVFTSCSSLKSVVIPKTVTSIDYSAFYGCSSLKELIIPNSVTTLGMYAFKNCSGLTSMTIPESIKEIPYYTFSGCTGLTGFTVGNWITSVGGYTFEDCTSIKSISIGKLVTFMGDYTFKNCSALKSLYVYNDTPIDFTYFAVGVFSAVNTDSCILYVPYGTKSLYAAAAQWKDFVNIVENGKGFLLSKNVIKLAVDEGSKDTVSINTKGDWTAVSDQTWLKVTPASGSGNNTITLTAEANLTTLVRTATVTVSTEGALPKTITVSQEASPKVKNITAGGLYASLNPDEIGKLTKLVVSGTIDARDFKTMRDNLPLLESIDLSAANIVAYSGNGGTSPYYDPNDYPANTIPEFAFFYYNSGIGSLSLKTIKLPATAQLIDNSAFKMCNVLSDITFPTVPFSTAINSFYSCDSLKGITLPDNIISIGASSFENCLSLRKINFPSSLTFIGDQAFASCQKLDNVVLPNSLTFIGSRVFYLCDTLLNVVLPDNLTLIPIEMFESCSRLKSVKIPESVIGIGLDAFNYCVDLKSITIPNSVTEIGGGAFSGCWSLSDVKIGNSVKSIGSYAFDHCNILTTISLPATVTQIDASAFYCPAMTSIYVYSSKPIIFDSWNIYFDGVDKTTCKLYVPSGTKALYQAAVEWKDFTNIIEMTTALSTVDESEISISPNPVTDIFRINGLNEMADLRITDINGKTVFTKQVSNNENISIGELPKGIYIARIIISNGTIERKLEKK